MILKTVHKQVSWATGLQAEASERPHRRVPAAAGRRGAGAGSGRAGVLGRGTGMWSGSGKRDTARQGLHTGSWGLEWAGGPLRSTDNTGKTAGLIMTPPRYWGAGGT